MNEIRDKFINEVLSEIRFDYDKKEIRNELDDHIDDSIEDLMNEGLTQQEAQIQAIRNMGDGRQIGKELDIIHNPIQGWIWLVSLWLRRAAVTFLILMIITLGSRVIQNYFAWNSFDDAIETIKVNQTIQAERYNLTIRNIFILEDNEAAVTYRVNYHLDHLFPIWGTQVIEMVESDGSFLSGGSGYGADSLGLSGFKRFTIPENKMIKMNLKGGSQVLVDLKSGEVELQ